MAGEKAGRLFELLMKFELICWANLGFEKMLRNIGFLDLGALAD